MDGASARALAVVLEAVQLQSNVTEELILDRERAAMQREDLMVLAVTGRMGVNRNLSPRTSMTEPTWREAMEEFSIEAIARRAEADAERDAHLATQRRLNDNYEMYAADRQQARDEIASLQNELQNLRANLLQAELRAVRRRVG